MNTCSAVTNVNTATNFNFCALVPGMQSSAKTFSVSNVMSNILLLYSSSNTWTSSNVTLQYDLSMYSGLTHHWWYMTAPYNSIMSRYGPFAPSFDILSWCDSSSPFTLMMTNLASNLNNQFGGVQATQANCNARQRSKDNFSWQVFTR
eukprot:TRINITY_DN902_c0_g1_i1.p1 TRINITY_DN902_c0_g1~~TRINITY_DN902_c0_g1_i1.p1  ORF type:complete len:148 (-),score=19.63 TRINITY_DN902_c0_g1_i1:202-645(-)